MEQLFATPVGRAEIILGKLIPYAALGKLDVTRVVPKRATFGYRFIDVMLSGGRSVTPTIAIIIGLMAAIVMGGLSGGAQVGSRLAGLAGQARPEPPGNPDRPAAGPGQFEKFCR